MHILSERMAYIVVLCGAILWGTSGTAQTFIAETVDPFIVATLRLAIGGFVLMVGLLFLGKLHLSKWPLKVMVLVAIVLACFQISFFSAVRMTGVAIGTVVTIGSAPMFAGLLEWFLLGSLPNRRWLIATSMAIIGSGLLFLNKELVLVNPAGVSIALIAGFLFASYTFLNKKVVEYVSAIEAVAGVFTLSALMLLPFYFIFSSEGLMMKSSFIAIVYIGLITAALGYVLFVMGLKYIPSSAATTLSLAEPFTATVLSVVIVGEQLNVSAWIGISLLLTGIIVLSIKPNLWRVSANNKE